MERALFFHLECPDYVRKIDGPEGYKYLKRQMFSLLLMPYVNLRMLQREINRKPSIVSDVVEQSKYIEYPEELVTSHPLSASQLVLNNKALRNKFVSGVEFTEDPPKEE